MAMIISGTVSLRCILGILQGHLLLYFHVFTVQETYLKTAYLQTWKVTTPGNRIVIFIGILPIAT